MAEHTVDTRIWLAGAYEDLPAYTRDGIIARRGAGAEGQEFPPSSLALTIANDDRSWSPTNPMGVVYGAAGRNTPTQLEVDGDIIVTAEASSWAPEESLGAHDAWVPLRAFGLMHRIQQGKTPLKGALERAQRAAAPVAFWPMNEPDTADRLSSGLPGANGFTLTGIPPGQIPGPAGTTGAFPGITHRAGSMFADGSFDPTGLTSAGWGFECIIYCGTATDPLIGAMVDPSTALAAFGVTGTASMWFVGAGVDDTDGPSITVVGSIGTANATVGVFEGLAFGWHHVRLTVADAGADVLLTLYVDGINTANAGGNFDLRTVVGVTAPTPTGRIQLGQKTIAGELDENAEPCSIGMLGFFTLAAATDRSAAAVGYPGELAGVRFLRLAGEENIVATVRGDELETQPMGPQPPDTLINLFRECARSDAGWLVEPAEPVALELVTGRALVNQDPVLTLNWTAAGIGPPFKPLVDDKPTRNYVVASNRFGGESVAVQEVGPLNVNDPFDDPDGVGKIDTKVDVNLDGDRMLYAHAGWHLGLGTCIDPRWPQLVVDLDDAPSLTASVGPVDIGDMIAISNLPFDWAQETVRLLVIGVENELPANAGHRRRLVKFVGVPAAPYEVGIVGAAAGGTNVRGGRVDTRLSTLDGAHTSGDTTLSVDSGGMPWTTTAAHWNPALNGGGLFLNLRGEKCRVTNITGAGSAWTVTVDRAVNGVALAHPDGTPVRMWTPIRVGV